MLASSAPARCAASAMRAGDWMNEMRKKPSPPAPNDEPAITTTPCSSSSRSVNSADGIPSGSLIQRYIVARGTSHSKPAARNDVDRRVAPLLEDRDVLRHELRPALERRDTRRLDRHELPRVDERLHLRAARSRSPASPPPSRSASPSCCTSSTASGTRSPRRARRRSRRCSAARSRRTRSPSTRCRTRAGCRARGTRARRARGSRAARSPPSDCSDSSDRGSACDRSTSRGISSSVDAGSPCAAAAR